MMYYIKSMPSMRKTEVEDYNINWQNNDPDILTTDFCEQEEEEDSNRLENELNRLA